MLKSLTLRGVGPVRNLSAEFGERLNVFTGDNGLGKSFLLDVAFWTLTGTWPGRRIALPDVTSRLPKIACRVGTSTRDAVYSHYYKFDRQQWDSLLLKRKQNSLVIYAAVDGSYAVWDPARNGIPDSHRKRNGADRASRLPQAFQFPPESVGLFDDGGLVRLRRDVANGLEEAGQVLCNGLIADWTDWYYRRSINSGLNAFALLEDIVSVMQHPDETIRCVEPRKVYLNDVRHFPALELPYGVIPYPHWPAGVKRIMSFAYLLVWAWVSHLEAVQMRKEEPTRRIILLVDEVEVHLHPKWQRTILPAILSVVQRLHPEVDVQILATTHSPLVLASLEPTFDSATDQLFTFQLDASQPQSKMVTLNALPWAILGDVVAWLTSDVFGLAQARSRRAEQAIEAAEAFLRGDTKRLPATLKTKRAIEDELRQVLGGLDPFWPRWVVETSR